MVVARTRDKEAEARQACKKSPCALMMMMVVVARGETLVACVLKSSDGASRPPSSPLTRTLFTRTHTQGCPFRAVVKAMHYQSPAAEAARKPLRRRCSDDGEREGQNQPRLSHHTTPQAR